MIFLRFTLPVCLSRTPVERVDMLTDGQRMVRVPEPMLDPRCSYRCRDSNRHPRYPSKKDSLRSNLCLLPFRSQIVQFLFFAAIHVGVPFPKIVLALQRCSTSVSCECVPEQDAVSTGEQLVLDDASGDRFVVQPLRGCRCAVGPCSCAVVM